MRSPGDLAVFGRVEAEEFTGGDGVDVKLVGMRVHPSKVPLVSLASIYLEALFSPGDAPDGASFR